MILELTINTLPKIAGTALLHIVALALSADSSTAEPIEPAAQEALREATGTMIGPLSLYEGSIPGSMPSPDRESRKQWLSMEFISQVSRPTYTVYLPSPAKATGAAVLIFPGGGYVDLSWDMEGRWIATALQDHGIAGVLVKYRLPSDESMIDKSVAPLQDAQQAIRHVRRQAEKWGVDPQKVGAIGFSAGGHLAAMLGTQFESPVAPNLNGANLRPDFLILVYPLIGFAGARTNTLNSAVRTALLGENPSEEIVRRFSADLHVTERTPPTLLLGASNDLPVESEHLIGFYRALRQRKVPAELVLFDRGQHGFFELTREEWQAPLWAWLRRNGWILR